MSRNRALTWNPTADGGPRPPGTRLLLPVGTCNEVFGQPVSVRSETTRLGALVRINQQRERKRVAQDELDRVPRSQRKAMEDDWTMRLQNLKNQVAAERQTTCNLHTYNQDLQEEYDSLRIQRDGEQQRLADDRAGGDQVIANRVSKLCRINDRIYAAIGNQR